MPPSRDIITTQRERRASAWAGVEGRIFDAAVIGGGINGASAFWELARRGHSVVLLERGDFAGGTSQASSMMVWGGLLYLKQLDFGLVRRMCYARDRMIDQEHAWVRARRYRYMPKPDAPMRGWQANAVLHFYWLLGGGRRMRPRQERSWPEQEFLDPGRLTESFIYEDAALGPSDARFVLRWVLGGRAESRVPLNYCSVEGGGFDSSARCWRLEVRDTLLERPAVIRARCVVNAAGGWTDQLNDRFARRTPYRHVLSKGVTIGLRRDPRLTDTLVFDTEHNGDSMVLIPWGPVALWGPTETEVKTPEAGFDTTTHDVRSLLDELNLNLATPVGPEEIVSVRAGVRPLAVRHGHAGVAHTLAISRHPRLHMDQHAPWVSVYGGKITDCMFLAGDVAGMVERVLDRNGAGERSGRGPLVGAPDEGLREPSTNAFPGMPDPVPGAEWCAEHEMCWTLEDYLRRRTNIAQWVPRAGLGAGGEHEAALLHLAGVFHDAKGLSARQQVERYKARVRDEFDDVLAGAGSAPVVEVKDTGRASTVPVPTGTP